MGALSEIVPAGVLLRLSEGDTGLGVWREQFLEFIEFLPFPFKKVMFFKIYIIEWTLQKK